MAVPPLIPPIRAPLVDPATGIIRPEWIAFFTPPPVGATSQSTPPDPVGSADLAGLMLGLAGSIAPVASGRVQITISGNLTNSSATAGDGAQAQIRYGVGAIPANGDPLAGTAIGMPVSSVLARAAADLQAFSCQAVVTGLERAREYWIDLSLAAITGGTAEASSLSVSAVEI